MVPDVLRKYLGRANARDNRPDDAHLTIADDRPAGYNVREAGGAITAIATQHHALSIN
jgi:hypothetical protein